jgi:hypothetical protein
MTRLRRLIRCGLFFVAAMAVWFFSTSLLWAPLLLLGLFFFAVDVLRIDKNRRSALDMEAQRAGQQFGVLGKHVVDGTESYGLFLQLLGSTLFIDIREDELLDERKRQAIFLFQNRPALEESLERFLETNEDYRVRRPTYIGLHAPTIDKCEVFWEPDGHSVLKGLEFHRE